MRLLKLAGLARGKGAPGIRQTWAKGQAQCWVRTHLQSVEGLAQGKHRPRAIPHYSSLFLAISRYSFAEHFCHGPPEPLPSKSPQIPSKTSLATTATFMTLVPSTCHWLQLSASTRAIGSLPELLPYPARSPLRECQWKEVGS